MKTDPVLGIFKFAKHKHIDDFVHGRLYMNRLGHFAKVEKTEIRRDKHEGQAFWMQPDKFTLSVEIEGVFHPIPGIIGPLAHTDESVLTASVFCMYALRGSVAKNLVPERFLEFGDTFAVITNGDEFIARVRAAA